MPTSFPCPHCGAEYTSDQVSSGQEFSCGACSATVVAPLLDAVPGRKAPLAKPRPGATPVPAAPLRKSAGSGVPRASQPADKRPGNSPSPAKRNSAAPPRKKDSKAKLFAIIGAVALVAIIAAIALNSGDKKENTPSPAEQNSKANPPEADPVKEAIASATAGLAIDQVEGAWTAVQRLDTEAKSWKEANRPARSVSLLQQEAERLRGVVLGLNPDHEALRLERGEVKYENTFLEFASAEWLPAAERAEARLAHEALAKASAKEKGWIKKEKLLEKEPLLARFQEMRTGQSALESTPWFTEAKKIENVIVEDLNGRFRDMDEGKWRGVDVAHAKPFVFFVQRDPSWDPKAVANSRSRSLKALEEIILFEYGAAVDLKPIEEPVPVLMFRTLAMYKKYAGKEEKDTTFAHFEPMTGRLAVHDDCDHTTIMHEGTHQLMWAWTSNKRAQRINPAGRSYWFQEGIAEWYGGAHRYPKAGGGYDYEVGRLHLERVNGLARHQGREVSNSLFTLKELIAATYGKRPKIEADGRVGQLYAQAWFLIYFMNHFNVSEDGYVDPTKHGKYRERWVEYVKQELQGRTGPEIFMSTMGLDDASFVALEKEYWRYFRYIRRKISTNQVSEKRVIPWTEYRNKRGEAIGEKEDDRLPDFNPEEAPPAIRGS